MAFGPASLLSGSGGGGAVISEAVAAALSTLAVIPQGGASSAGRGTVYPYRPALWKKKALYSVTVPASSTAAAYDSNGVLRTTTTASTIYVFDAVLSGGHTESETITQHPIQTGANIADHAFSNAPQITLEIGMSDAMDSFTSGMWTGNTSKSVACWLTLKRLKDARVPLTLATRLDTYTNCLIASMQSPDTNRTRYGLRATVTFQKIFTADVATLSVSARPQTTDTSGNGVKQGAVPSAPVTQQHQLPSSFYTTITPSALKDSYGMVPNAGSWSSNSIASIPTGR